jgi:hypothetical protein
VKIQLPQFHDVLKESICLLGITPLDFHIFLRQGYYSEAQLTLFYLSQSTFYASYKLDSYLEACFHILKEMEILKVLKECVLVKGFSGYLLSYFSTFIHGKSFFRFGVAIEDGVNQISRRSR